MHLIWNGTVDNPGGGRLYEPIMHTFERLYTASEIPWLRDAQLVRRLPSPDHVPRILADVVRIEERLDRNPKVDRIPYWSGVIVSPREADVALLIPHAPAHYSDHVPMQRPHGIVALTRGPIAREQLDALVKRMVERLCISARAHPPREERPATSPFRITGPRDGWHANPWTPEDRDGYEGWLDGAA